MRPNCSAQSGSSPNERYGEREREEMRMVGYLRRAPNHSPWARTSRKTEALEPDCFPDIHQSMHKHHHKTSMMDSIWCSAKRSTQSYLVKVGNSVGLRHRQRHVKRLQQPQQIAVHPIWILGSLWGRKKSIGLCGIHNTAMRDSSKESKDIKSREIEHSTLHLPHLRDVSVLKNSVLHENALCGDDLRHHFRQPLRIQNHKLSQIAHVLPPARVKQGEMEDRMFQSLHDWMCG
jgi:hypothetical protein